MHVTCMCYLYTKRSMAQRSSFADETCLRVRSSSFSFFFFLMESKVKRPMRSSALRFGKKKKRGGLLNAAAKESKRKKKRKNTQRKRCKSARGSHKRARKREKKKNSIFSLKYTTDVVNKKRHTHKKKKHDEWRARGNREHLKNYRNVQTLFFSPLLRLYFSLLSFTARMTKPTPSWLIYFSSATANNRKKKEKGTFRCL